MHQLLTWLADHLIGPACPICHERQVGERHLYAHLRVDHADTHGTEPAPAVVRGES